MDQKYLSKFQYIGSTIRSLKIRNDFIIIEESNVKREIDLSHEVKDITYDDVRESFMGILHLKVKASTTQKKKKYIIDLVIEGCFEAEDKSLTKESFDEMLRINGLTSLYSITRGIVQSISSHTMPNGTVLLPMVNILEYSYDTTPDNQNLTTT